MYKTHQNRAVNSKLSSLNRIFLICLLLLSNYSYAQQETAQLLQVDVDKKQDLSDSKPVSDDYDAGTEAFDLGKLTLSEAIEISLQNNPDIAIADYEREASEMQQKIAESAILPELSLSGGYEMYRDDRLITPRRMGTSEVLKFTDELVSGDILLSMPIYAGGRLIDEIESSKLLADSKKSRLMYKREELIFNVSSVFYSILSQEKVIESLAFSEKTLQEHFNTVQQLFAASKAAQVDLLRTEVRLADIRQKLIRERNVLSVKYSIFSNFLGLQDINDAVKIKGSLEKDDYPQQIADGFASALGNRDDYQALKFQVQAWEKKLEISKAQRLPEVHLRASYGNRWDAGSSNNNEVGAVGIYAKLPLFEGGRIDASIRKDRFMLSAQLEALRKLELRIKLEVDTAASNIESTFARIGVTKKAVEQAKESLRIEREKYELGKGAIVDVLDAQSSLLNAQMSYYTSLAEYKTAISQFNLAIGNKQS